MEMKGRYVDLTVWFALRATDVTWLPSNIARFIKRESNADEYEDIVSNYVSSSNSSIAERL